MATRLLFNKISTVVNGLTICGTRNDSSALFRTAILTLQTPKRNASIHLSNRFVRKMKAEHVTPLGWALLAVPISTFGLGLWQIQRKKWKVAFIKQLHDETIKPAVELPETLSDLNDMEYRQVKVRGRFLHDKELYMGPRSFIDEASSMAKGSVFSTQNPGSGFLVITPFKLDDRDETILVNRGWVPRNRLDPKTRPEGQIQDTIELIGIVRKGETRPQFTPKAKGKHLLYRDFERMCNLTGADPVYIDANVQSTIPGGPIGGQTRVTMRDEHLTYVVTWLSLSILTTLFWYKLVYVVK